MAERRTLVAVGLALALGSGCDEPVEDQVVEGEGVIVDEVRYEQDWSWGEAEPGPDGQGFSLTTDLGFRVEVERGWITTYAASLVPCPEPVEEQDTMAALGRWLVPVAHAGHSGSSDVSTLPRAVIEDLGAPGPTHLGTVPTEGARYCRLHWLAAAAPDDAQQQVGEEALGTTLVLRGRVQAPDDDQWWALEIETSLANGSFLELPALALPEGALTVTVHRRLDTLLDGIDLRHDEPTVIEQQVLRNLIDHASLDASATTP